MAEVTRELIYAAALELERSTTSLEQETRDVLKHARNLRRDPAAFRNGIVSTCRRFHVICLEHQT